MLERSIEPFTSASPAEAEDTARSPAQTERSLARSRILVVGLEPWGAIAAADLAAAGVGTLHVLDDRDVTADDLLAARLFSDEDLGNDRAATLVEAVSRLAPGCSITSGRLSAAAHGPIDIEETRWDLVLACVPADDLFVLQSVARFAHAAGVISLSAHLEGLDAVIGPAVAPGKTACFECTRLRRLAQSRTPHIDYAIHETLLSSRTSPRARICTAPMPVLLGHALALAALDLLVHSEAAAILGRLVVQNLVTLERTVHGVLPMPTCAICGGAAASSPDGILRDGSGVRLDAARDADELRKMLEGVVDARTGIISEIRTASWDSAIALELPKMAGASLGDYSIGKCPHHRHEPEGGGGKGLTPLDAMLGAVGEAVERYAAAYVDMAAIRRASVAEMKEDFIAPGELCLYDESQYAQPDFQFSRITAEMPIDWTRGHWLDTGEPVWLPAHPTYYGYPTPGGEYFCQITSNGLAAGATLEDASLRAALELIERDAFMLTWLARIPGKRVRLDGSVDPAARVITRQLSERGMRVELYLLDVGLRVPSVMGVGFGDGERWPGAMVSLSAHLSPRVAIKKAVMELGQGAHYIHQLMMDPNKQVPERPEDVLSLDDHALYYVPPRRAAAFAFLAEGDSVAAEDLEEPEATSLDVLARRLREAKLRIAVADVTSPDLRRTPFRVARALGPNFQQIHFGHVLARLGNPRLHAMAPRGINPDPHPLD